LPYIVTTSVTEHVLSRAFRATVRAKPEELHPAVAAETRSFPIFDVAVWTFHSNIPQIVNYTIFLWIVICFLSIEIQPAFRSSPMALLTVSRDDPTMSAIS
jgi:hypothetical protein